MLELESGKQLARRYTLVRRLGGDSEAQIWLATDRMTAASVALKVVPASAASRLRSEWQSSIRLMHAHIVRVFEFHDDAETAFFSMQYVDGPTVTALAGRPPQDVLPAIGLIANALKYLHDKGIVHRDIKASNLLLDANGAPYVSDLGVAAETGVLRSGGSLIAKSPAALDGQPAAPADDIFALGAVIYELLSGRSPWSSAATEADIRQATPSLLTGPRDEALPEAVVALVESMLDRDADRRPDATEVAERLSAAGFRPGAAPLRGVRARSADEEVVASLQKPATGRSAAAASDGIAAPDAATETSGLNRRVVFAALGVLVAVLLGVVFLLPQQLEERQSRQPRIVEPAPTPRNGADDSTAEQPATVAPKVDVDVYVDPEIRARLRDTAILPSGVLEGDDDITFNENQADYSGLDAAGRSRYFAESTLGELLAGFEVLEGRGIERWASVEHRRARDYYQLGDKEYLEGAFANAEEYYLAALTVLEPLYERIQPTFDKAFADAEAAFAAGDRLEALRLYELAVAVTPTHAGATAGLRRAQNLEDVQRLVKQGSDYEDDQDYVAAQRSFERAIELDPAWQPATDGLARVQQARTELEFDARMSEGFEMIASGDYLGARAAFRMAQQLIPESAEPADGLLQVDQGLRLRDITTLEQEALALETDEHWDAVISTYEEILKVDNTLEFAKSGLQRARQMSAVHKRLDDYIAEPDSLSRPSVMQQATTFVVEITTSGDIGPRLAAQRDELSRLLKRAATPLPVPLVSDNATDVTVYRVGRLGRFQQREISLRPGTYVAVGSRAGFRDVRLEFRVAPEVELAPVVIQCEEPI